MEELDLHSNMLNGRIPRLSFSTFFVDLSSNNLSSSLPRDIGDYLTFASFFSVANNNISGTIPPSLCKTSSMKFLDLSNNSFHGRIPSCLVGEALMVLNMRRNNISADIPDMFPVDCGLETLDLSWNGLQGQVPISLSRCSEIKVLNLGHNNLNDTFPCSFKDLSGLHVLELRSNKFHGNISCLQEDNYTWRNLQIINLASNDFSGALPRNLFQNMKALKGDLKGTQPQLGYLRPHLADYIDYRDSVNVTFKGLDLDLVKILIIFTSIDFEGVIPETIGELKLLQVLNFAHNALSGKIPSSVGNLRKLESLDLSFNHLGGEIPQLLASLTFLEFLNLSHNKLVGRIPRGPQMNTFSESSFQGNREYVAFH